MGYDPITGKMTVEPTGSTDAWQTDPDWVGQEHVPQPSALDSRIADLSGIYGDYSSALGNAQVNFDPFRQFYNQYYGQPSSGSSFGGSSFDQGGGWSAQSATGQYLPIEQALQGAQSYYGGQQGRFNQFYGDQQTRYGNLADQFLDFAQGTPDAEGKRTGGFYADQYANAMGGANSLYDLGMGAMGDDGTRTGGFFADQFAGATGDAWGMRNRLTGDIDPLTGMATGGLYGTQYNMDTTFASTIYDLAGGAFDDTGTRMGGFYQDQATSAISAANAAYNSAAAEAVATDETRAVVDEFGVAVLDEAGEPVTEDVVTYQGGFYSVQEANQIRRANMAQTQAVAQAAAVRAQQVQTATNLYNDAKQFFSNEKDLALGMLAAMEGEAGGGGARGRYTQQMSFFGEQEQRGVAELARQIGVINAENLRRSGRVGTYEDLMVGEVDPLTGERARFGGRIGEQEQALLERIGGLQSAATTEMDTVRASETQRLADLRSGYGEDISGAVAALQAQGIDPTQLQAMTAQTGALLGAQEASQLAMLDRLQRAEGMLGAEQTLAASSMAGDARLALENQLFSTRAGIEEDIYGRLEGVEQQRYGVAEGARGGEFQAGQTLSGTLDELGREAFGYGSQARSGEFGARQSMEGTLGAAAIGESERVFDAGQRQAATIGAAGDAARAGIFQSEQQRAAAEAQAYAMQNAGLFNSENAYESALAQAQSNLLSGTTQAQMSYDQALQNARDAYAQGGYQSNMWLGQQQQDAASAQALGGFGAQNQYYQSMFDAMEQAQAGRFNAAETAGTGVFNAEQQAAASARAVEASQFEQMMDLFMQESAQGANLQGNLAQGNLTRDLAINAATQQSESDIQQAEAATAAGVASMQAWFAPGSSTARALWESGYTPESIAGFDSTTLRAIVTDYNDQVRYQNENVNTSLPWDQRTYYNYPDEGMGEFRQGAAFEQQLGMDPEGAGMGLMDYAASLGFQPWQDPMTYSNADYARGDLPGSYNYQPDPMDWVGRDQAYDPTTNTGTGVGFPLGTIDQYGATLDNLPGLKQYGALQGHPYPTGEMAEPEAIAQWYQDVIALSQGLPLPTREE
jgi:hypothetical protein